MKKAGFIMLAVVVSSTADAFNLVPSESSYYYEIGAGSDLAIPQVTADHEMSIGGNINAQLGFTCSGFNPVLSLTNSLNEIKTKMNGLPEAVMNNLKIGAMSYPAYKLAQTNPDLYNIFQNESLNGREDFNFSMKDCNQIHNEIRQGVSPYEEYFKISDSQGWLELAKKAEQQKDVDINKAKNDVVKNRKTYGLPWVHHGQMGHKNSGGSGQVPIKLISDVAIAGYNVLVSKDRALDDLSIPQNTKQHFTQFWQSPKDAAAWATLVLGDITISLDEKNQQTKAGVGLTSLLDSCPKGTNGNICVATVSDALWKLVKKNNTLTVDELRSVSASNLFITEEIIVTIRHMDAERKALTVAKLAEEVAIQNLLEEALSLRRILQAGFQVQEVQNLKPAREMITHALKQLSEDIYSLSYEHKVRHDMMTSTLKTISLLRDEHRANSLDGSHASTAIIQNGAIYKNSEKKQ